MKIRTFSQDNPFELGMILERGCPSRSGRHCGRDNQVTGPSTGLGRAAAGTAAVRFGCGFAAPCFSDQRRRRRNRCAFSLIEIMVVVSLMTVIVLGLMAMFGQTQRAFRSSMTQVDVLATGRATMDLLVRELEQMTAAYRTNVDNFYVTRADLAPLVQVLPGTTEKRTNVLEEFFFLTRENQQWIGTGYFTTNNAGVATLFRFYTNAPVTSIAHFTSAFERQISLVNQKSALASANRIADGIVHLKVQAYNTNGYPIVRSPDLNLIRVQTNDFPAMIKYSFRSNAVPAYLEVELGILEERTLERARSIPNQVARRKFLEDRAGQVHLFRQRIPVRNVDPTAYQ